MKLTVTVFPLSLWLFLSTLTEGFVLLQDNDLRCQCLKSETRVIPLRLIQDVQCFPKNNYCNTIELIVTLKSQVKVCIEPSVKWLRKVKHMACNRVHGKP
ncbi:C-X-C motif chemokine 13-like [Protopterus annectens]|uniref:C-X-C motif chemokine 13-like n=1 Tax=Protopterus annectens TaxID=7888 RepID=UPI001CFA8C76|nr:C-X-C motif chemokine 13-like [Protopterus annectens]